MRANNGLKPLWKKREVNMLFEKLAERAEFVILDLLARTGEEFVKVARLHGKYNDHTGNLRSSIGYVIVKNGAIKQRNFKQSELAGTDKISGVKEGEALAVSVANTFTKGYVLIGVAGMKYAAIVEAMENKDVVSLAADKAKDFIRIHSLTLFNKINE